MQEQLDKTIEIEQKLQANISKLTEYKSKIDMDNKRLERERQKARKVAENWWKQADQSIASVSDL